MKEIGEPLKDTQYIHVDLGDTKPGWYKDEVNSLGVYHKLIRVGAVEF